MATTRYVDLMQQGFMKPKKQTKTQAKKRDGHALARALREHTGVPVFYDGFKYQVDMPQGHTNHISSYKEAKALVEGIARDK